MATYETPRASNNISPNTLENLSDDVNYQDPDLFLPLSDEELFTCFVSGYFPLGSIKGEWGLETNHQKDTVVIVDAGEILARSLYKELIDCRKRNEENFYISYLFFIL